MAEGDNYPNVHVRGLETTKSNEDGKGQRYEGEIIKEKLRVEVKETATAPLLLPEDFARDNTDGPKLHNYRPSLMSSIDSSDDDDDEIYIGRTHKIKRRTKQLCINRRTRLFNITTCKYRYRNHKFQQHYVTDIEKSTDIEGETGVVLNDELYSVKKVQLQGKKQKDVIKIFKKIKPDSSGFINLELELRRWRDQNAGPVQSTIIKIRLNVQLKPEKGNTRGSVKKKNQKDESQERLPTGNVKNITFGCNRNASVKVLATEASYLLVSDAGSISTGILDQGDCVNTGISKFDVTPFQGYDDSAMPDVRWVFGVIIHCDVDGHTMYMTSCFGDKSDGLVFRQLSDIDDNLKKSPDERFFLMHEFGNKTILESMLYRGQCVHYNATSNALNMQALNMQDIDTIKEDTYGDFLMDFIRLDSNRTPHFSRQLTTMPTDSTKCIYLFSCMRCAPEP